MSSAWRVAWLFLSGSLVMLLAGAWTTRTARQQARLPQHLEQARQALDQAGGEEGVQERQRHLTVIRNRLILERSAKGSDSALFSHRLERALAEVGLRIHASSEWQPAPETAVQPGATFERTFHGTGALASLLRAIHTLESWPDQPRIRELSVESESADRVAFVLRIAAIRLPRSAAGESG
ncbi:MAG: hypothetical protein AAF657_21975 [Acidobacteriota bacterium]